jgi:hypothetical protein
LINSCFDLPIEYYQLHDTNIYGYRRFVMKELSVGFWKKSRDNSDWHFDFSRPPEPGKDSFTKVGTFSGDWLKEIEECNRRATPVNATSLYKGVKEEERIKGLSPYELDLVANKIDPAQENHDRCDATDVEIFDKMAKALGLSNCTIRYNNQRPGQMTHYHIDDLNSLRLRYPEEYTDWDRFADPDRARRFAIMLEDWRPGQVFQIGNGSWERWRAGECVTWEWKDLPHGTANFGFWRRPMVQITGAVSDKTNLVLSQGQDQIISI